MSPLLVKATVGYIVWPYMLCVRFITSASPANLLTANIRGGTSAKTSTLRLYYHLEQACKILLHKHIGDILSTIEDVTYC